MKIMIIFISIFQSNINIEFYNNKKKFLFKIAINSFIKINFFFIK